MTNTVWPKKYCIQCGINEVQGCRCVTGASYCSICKPAHPRPKLIFEEVYQTEIKKAAEDMIEYIFKDIEKIVDKQIVYVVKYYDYDGDYVDSIYSTKQKADKYIQTLEDKYHYDIEEYEVN